MPWKLKKAGMLLRPFQWQKKEEMAWLCFFVSNTHIMSKSGSDRLFWLYMVRPPVPLYRGRSQNKFRRYAQSPPPPPPVIIDPSSFPSFLFIQFFLNSKTWENHIGDGCACRPMFPEKMSAEIWYPGGLKQLEMRLKLAFFWQILGTISSYSWWTTYLAFLAPHEG